MTAREESRCEFCGRARAVLPLEQLGRLPSDGGEVIELEHRLSIGHPEDAPVDGLRMVRAAWRNLHDRSSMVSVFVRSGPLVEKRSAHSGRI
jgi:hypothetical protein